MNAWIGRIIVAVLFIAVLALPLAWRSSAEHQPQATLRLVILSPHNEQIRYEFGLAFSRWHERRYGQPVYLDWRNVGGTADIERILRGQFRTLAEQGLEDRGVQVDLVFGGGDYSFEAVLKRGVEVSTLDGSGQPVLRQVSITQPIEIDPQLKAAVYPTQRIADKPLYDPDGHWWGTALSSFGIVYNVDVLAARGLPQPLTWSDLADFRYFGWLALADPSHSGSVRVTYDAILQRYGFQRGIDTLRAMFANARYFAPGSTQVPVDVSAGEAAAGVCIDFYGRYQSQTIDNGQRIGYIAPADATVITADPIAVVRGAPSRELAIRFVEFTLSYQGQALWNFRRGTTAVAPVAVEDPPRRDPPWRNGSSIEGPQRFELRRSPIRRDMYELFPAEMVDQDNPFDIAQPLPPNTPTYFTVIPTLLHAMCMDVHDELRAAWKAVHITQDAELRAAMLVELQKLPFTSDELLAARQRWRTDPHAQTQDRLTWTAYFRGQYARIIQMSE